MPGTAAAIASLLESIARDTLTQFEGISPQEFNRKLTLPESNTLFALATHQISSGEFWVLVLVGKYDIPRNRPSEFSATGRLEELQARYERWIESVHSVLDTFPDARLDELAEPPAGYHSFASSLGERTTVRDALLHAVEHSALHQGHIQLTRQMLGYPPAGEE